MYLHPGIYKIAKTLPITAFLFLTQLFQSPVYT